MDLKYIIIKELEKREKVGCEEIVKLTGITRQAVHKHLKELIKRGKVIKVGKTRGAYYILNTPQKIRRQFGRPVKKTVRLINEDLNEDLVLKDIKETTLLFDGLKENIIHIIDYAFTEMLNNAIVHSESKKLYHSIAREGRRLSFQISDRGIGVFFNIRRKFHLNNEWEALQELIKGKSTTNPKEHTGEGIFFTSKIADTFRLSSHATELFIDNTAGDTFAKETKKCEGTKVEFSIDIESEKSLEELFKEFSTENFEFDKSRVDVRLFTGDTEYISRSQAKRLLSNLDKYRVIVLDFKEIRAIGQGFADQIFRVFKNDHPSIQIEAINLSPPVEMMIKRAKGAV